MNPPQNGGTLITFLMTGKKILGLCGLGFKSGIVYDHFRLFALVILFSRHEHFPLQ